jgi:hypothetical protein
VHRDLARSQQRQNNMAAVSAEGRGLDPPLELFVQSLDRI